MQRIPLLLTDADSRAAAESVISGFTHSLGNVNIALFVIGILAALIGFMAKPGGVDLEGHPEVARIAIGALALGALWIAGLHFWSVILVVVFVIVGFAAVARAEQLDKGEPPPPSSPEPPSPEPLSPPEPPVSSTSAPTSS